MTTLTATTESTLLRRALQGNATFSTITGLISLFAANSLASFIGIQPPAVFIGLGLLLLIFAAGLFWLTRETAVDLRQARTIIIMDVLWVVGSIVLLLGDWLPLTVAGKWTIALIADAVATFALLQYLGLRRITTQ